MLKSFDQLDTSHRGEPCVEYPGAWIVYTNGEEHGRYADRTEALRVGTALGANWDLKIAVAWSCDDNDPRIGKVWFTGYYTFLTIDRGRPSW